MKLVSWRKTLVSPGIYLTTRDVREFQNAKAAIGAGIRVITKTCRHFS